MAAVWGCVMMGQGSARRIWFTHQEIDFHLDSAESAQRHVPETMAGGVALFDYNNDGALDVFFVNGADLRTLRKSDARYGNKLFANDGKGHFQDVTERAGLTGEGFDNAVAIGDYDNDGYKDMFVAGLHRNTLYHNNRNGTFADVTAKAGLGRPESQYGPLWGVGAAWADFNNDGRLDLFVADYLAWNIDREPPCEYRGIREYCHPKFYKPTPNRLFLNNGDGTFTDVSATSGIRSSLGKAMGVAVADYDLDGRMDIVVTNDNLPNSLFHNKGAGKFEEVALEAGMALLESGVAVAGMGVDFKDLDNDGYPDITLAALDNETFPLFRNNGQGEFLDLTSRSRMGPLSVSMAGYSPTIADFDNDGWKDIFVTRGHVQPKQAARVLVAEQANSVFRNLGGLRFEALTSEAGLTAQPPRRHRGSAVGDLNGDGRLDVVVVSLSGPAEIWINESAGGHWLELQLEGTRSNRDGIGARVKVVSKGGQQFNHVTFAAGYASASAGPLHFGLGADETASTIEIRWPSGQLQRLSDVKGGRVVKVREPE
jgi:hypothetical protein